MTTKTTKTTRKHIIIALALAGVAACDDGSTTDLAPNTRVEAGLQQVLDKAVAKQDVFVPGAITYYDDPGFAPWSGSAGLADRQAQVPLRASDRIRAGSIVKTFIATVTLQMVEEGKLSLDQTLTQLLPAAVTDRVASADDITLRMLLSHTSGIPEWVNDEVHIIVARDPGHVWTTDEAIDIAAKQPSTFPPGTSWSYSNTNYTLIGLVLERAAGKSWREQVRARVLARVGMASTLLPEPGDVSMPVPYARGYVDAGGTVVDLTQVDPSMAGASGGNAMITTVQDLARFLDALLAGSLFARPETLVAMTTMIDAPHESGLPHRYGMGLETFTMPGGQTVIGHAGGAAGYAVMMFQIVGRGTTLVTAINASDLFANALPVFIPSLDVISAPAPQK